MAEPVVRNWRQITPRVGHDNAVVWRILGAAPAGGDGGAPPRRAPRVRDLLQHGATAAIAIAIAAATIATAGIVPLALVVGPRLSER